MKDSHLAVGVVVVSILTSTTQEEFPPVPVNESVYRVSPFTVKVREPLDTGVTEVPLILAEVAFEVTQFRVTVSPFLTVVLLAVKDSHLAVGVVGASTLTDT